MNVILMIPKAFFKFNLICSKAEVTEFDKTDNYKCIETGDRKTSLKCIPKMENLSSLL